MGISFDHAPDRPDHIETILTGLDRYNPESTLIFQDYVQQQCEERTYDCYANLALMKLYVAVGFWLASLLTLHASGGSLLTKANRPSTTITADRYQFNPPLSRDETITNILVKALTVFPAPDFSLCMHLLPPNLLVSASAASASSAPPLAQASSHSDPDPTPAGAAAAAAAAAAATSTTTPPARASSGDPALAEAVQKLFALNTLLNSAEYAAFWQTLDRDDLYADLTADVAGFEELIRVRIAVCVGQAFRTIARPVLESWLSLQGKEFERFVCDVCLWRIQKGGSGGDAAADVDGDADANFVVIPLNKDNEAKGSVLRENVRFDQFTRMIHRAYEQPA
ncbi:MAG: hypothetical protein M1826_004996 [Phylliscum demangeonii]|nr:MAG: hypothetical protein M1826_004996 [Phylliscum demangeonii]